MSHSLHVSDVADGDGRGVAAGLLGRGREVAERRVGDAVGVEVERGRVVGSRRSMRSLEASARPPVAHASMRAASLTSSPSAVTSAASGGRDLRRRRGWSPSAGRSAGRRRRAPGRCARRRRRRGSQRAGRRDACARGGRLRAGGLGEEERDDAVADVPADQAARVDHALVGGANQAPPQREVAGGGQAPGERRRGLKVGEQDRRRRRAGADTRCIRSKCRRSPTVAIAPIIVMLTAGLLIRTVPASRPSGLAYATSDEPDVLLLC